MTPDLRSYDWIVINSSAGKDSQCMLDVLAEQIREAGVEDRVVVVHCDLGRVEWAGTRELAERQCAMYGYRFEVVSRPQGDLLYQAEHQRKMWPSASARWCTSDQKTGQVKVLLTRLVEETNTRRRSAIRGPLPRVRILNCLGIRGQESAARAKKPAWSLDSASNGKRHIDRWLPIHEWSEDQVWARIKASGVPHHPAYDAGMPRLSCVFCVLSSKSALVRAAQLNPELAAEYVAVEARIGHRFRKELSMAEIVEEAQRTPLTMLPVASWAA